MFGSCGPTSYDDVGLVSYAISGSHMMIATCNTFMSNNHVSNYEIGDICVSPNHCGIYIGNGQMVYASTFGVVDK